MEKSGLQPQVSTIRGQLRKTEIRRSTAFCVTRRFFRPLEGRLI